MCLEKLVGSSHKPKKGYKVGRIDDDDCFNYCMCETPMNQWSAFNGGDIGVCLTGADNGGKYVPGFHIIKTLKDARRVLKANNYNRDEDDAYSIFPCEYIGVMAEGVESSNICCDRQIPIVVAACIKISSKSVK